MVNLIPKTVGSSTHFKVYQDIFSDKNPRFLGEVKHEEDGMWYFRRPGQREWIGTFHTKASAQRYLAGFIM